MISTHHWPIGTGFDVANREYSLIEKSFEFTGDFSESVTSCFVFAREGVVFLLIAGGKFNLGSDIDPYCPSEVGLAPIAVTEGQVDNFLLNGMLFKVCEDESFYTRVLSEREVKAANVWSLCEPYIDSVVSHENCVLCSRVSEGIGCHIPHHPFVVLPNGMMLGANVGSRQHTQKPAINSIPASLLGLCVNVPVAIGCGPQFIEQRNRDWRVLAAHQIHHLAQLGVIKRYRRGRTHQLKLSRNGKF